jgi:hypothetical protein
MMSSLRISLGARWNHRFRISAINGIRRRTGRIIEVATGERFHGSARRMERLVRALQGSKDDRRYMRSGRLAGRRGIGFSSRRQTPAQDVLADGSRRIPNGPGLQGAARRAEPKRVSRALVRTRPTRKSAAEPGRHG